MTRIIRVLANKSRSLLRRTAGVIGVGSGFFPESKGKKLTEAQEKIAEKNQRLKRTRRRLAKREEEIAKLQATIAARDYEAEAGGIKPENIVWILGSGRSGSTWLARMMGDVEGQTIWFEPHVGDLFDPIRLKIERRKGGKHFILGERYKDSWLKLIRAFVLQGARVRFPQMQGSDHLVIKEPSGSAAAPLLIEATPESRIVLLVRDPRDVAASWLGAHKKGGWVDEKLLRDGSRQRAPVDKQLNDLVQRAAGRYLQNVGNAHKAYEAHKGRKVLVRYEELRSDALGTMKRLYSELGIEVDGEELSEVVEKHSWESIPEEKKGEGKFYRKAAPGSWKEDLTSGQVEIVEQLTAPILKEFYGG